MHVVSIALLCSGLFGAAAPVLACPAALFDFETAPRMSGVRQGVRLFAKSSAAGLKNGVAAIPIQIDPVDGDGHLMFFDDSSYMGKNLDRIDMFSFRVEDFGDKIDPKKEKLPCQGPHVYEVKDEKGRYAYLTNCGVLAAPVFHPFKVSFEKDAHLLESPVYRYKFNPENYMQFNSIAFKSGTGWATVAEDSRMLIRADVKNFFDMNFDSRQIESHLEASRLGPVGNLARLSFYLRILFFKIDLKLSTDVGFYQDSGRIPMMVNIPVNAQEYLHPGSGILYSWALSPEAEKAPKEINMPPLDVAEVRKGHKEYAKTGLKNCKGNDCTFIYTVDFRGQRMSMDIVVKKPLVERGFFPAYVDDILKYQDQMGWDLNFPKGTKRPGLYFEVSGLPKGGHPWDFWLRLGTPREALRGCPAMVHVSRI